MRILAVGNMYPPHHMGGYELVWQGAMDRARERGHDVRVLTSTYRRADAEAEAATEPDVHRELGLYWSWEEHDWIRLGPFERYRFARAQSGILGRHVAEFGPDVVSFWSMGGMSLGLVEAASRGPVPTVLVVHDDWLVYGPKRDAWMRAWTGWRRPLAGPAATLTRLPTRFSRERRERVLSNSEFIRRRAEDAGYRLANAAVVTPGIAERFEAPPAPPRDWRWRLLCAGRVDRHKGTDTALAALAALPDEATLVIAGSGDDGYAAELGRLAGDLGVDGRVRFTGQVDQATLTGLYDEADAAVFPVRWEEPFGLVPLEAMARGRPVIATAGGGSAEYLRDGENALIVSADDPAAIADSVRRLAADDALRATIVTGGEATAAMHTARRFEDRMVDEFERAAT